MNVPNPGDSSVPGDPVNGEVRPKRLGDLQKTITMAQIAKTAGVSQGAISSLLNDRDYGIRVSERTRERVFKVCREMGYIPNDLRAVVRMYPEWGDYCLLISTAVSGGLSLPLASRTAAAAIAAAHQGGRALTVAYYDEERDYLAEAELLPHPVESGVCSKFLCLGGGGNSLFQALHRRGSPVVAMGREVWQAGVLSLTPDYAQAARLAIQHLAKLGHKQIAIVSGPFGSSEPSVLELNRGVQAACNDFALSLDAQKIVYGDLTAEAGRAALENLFPRKSEPTAIFCMSDAAAAGVLAAAHARGLKVPAQLSIIGCSDDPCGELLQPQLTTIHLPLEEMAALAIKEIDRLVCQAPSDEPRRISLEARLVQRASTAIAKNS